MARVKTSGNGNTRKKQVATMPAVNSPEPKKTLPPTDLEVEIRRRAYELYEQRGKRQATNTRTGWWPSRKCCLGCDQQQSA